jgi:phage terminase Nu1 subunit (DNA packaging protein)
MSDRAIYFMEDLVQLLGTSRRTIQRLRRHGAFPIAELPALDKRPRWSRVAVERYLASEGAHVAAPRSVSEVGAMTIVRWLCRLFHRHQELLTVERQRIYVRCASCEWQSDGITVE